MYQIMLKLRMLRFFGWDLRNWYNVIWKQDWSERMCCTGYMCGCQGSDYGSYWEYLLEKNDV